MRKDALEDLEDDLICRTPELVSNNQDCLLIRGVMDRDEEALSDGFYINWRNLALFLECLLKGLRLKLKKCLELLNFVGGR